MSGARSIVSAPGLSYVPGYLNRDDQDRLLQQVRAVLAVAPLFRPTMPGSGAPFSVLMSNSGRLGWISDRSGYRYEGAHPVSGAQWPVIPDLALEAWHALSAYPQPPEACLINYYDPTARMGLHQDRDEASYVAPVVSLSLGDTCVFRFGGRERRGPTRSIRLASGDALVLGGEARLAFHGVDRLLRGSSTLLAEGGRFNLTMRRVSAEPLEASG